MSPILGIKSHTRVNMNVRQIVIRVSDGLGNQLFEYALGKYLSDKIGCEMVFDKSHFLTSQNRTFQLDRFVGPAEVLRWGRLKELAFLLLWIVNVKLGEKLFRAVLLIFGMRWMPVKDPFRLQADFDDGSIASWKGTIYLSGCYGHVPHLPARDVLQDRLRLVNPPNTDNQRYIDAMRQGESVSVHVRRTDYLLAVNNAPVLGVSYQRKAMDVIRQKVSSPRWFIFSDDIEWCRKEFSDMKDAVFVSGNDAEPWEDIRLMSACKHHIIANSTFSWWGAYLGEEGGITLYPKPWFKGLDMPASGVPAEWIAVSSE